MFPRLHEWVHRHPYRTYTLVGLILIATASLIATAILSVPPKPLDTTPITIAPRPEPPKVYYSPLTGVQVDDEDTTKQAVTGIMIENSPDARPQSGLKDAGIVYEAIAEGGITRFLALYQEAKPKLIGPVRSVRMYYIDWVAPYNASVAHIGGSWNALKEVRNGKYRDIDQFFNAASYWRATDRYAPHNVYTNFSRLDKLNNQKGYTTSSFTSWPRQDGNASDTPDATKIDLTISGPLYNPHYDYDVKSNTYKRSIYGQASNDREKGRLSPSVVIAIKVNMVKVFEDGWRESITTTGKGQAYIFQNGTVTKATWQKDSRFKPLKFLDSEGQEIVLNRGQTWIAAVPNGSGDVKWK